MAMYGARAHGMGGMGGMGGMVADPLQQYYASMYNDVDDVVPRVMIICVVLCKPFTSSFRA